MSAAPTSIFVKEAIPMDRVFLKIKIEIGKTLAFCRTEKERRPSVWGGVLS